MLVAILFTTYVVIKTAFAICYYIGYKLCFICTRRKITARKFAQNLEKNKTDCVQTVNKVRDNIKGNKDAYFFDYLFGNLEEQREEEEDADEIQEEDEDKEDSEPDDLDDIAPKPKNTTEKEEQKTDNSQN